MDNNKEDILVEDGVEYQRYDEESESDDSSSSDEDVYAPKTKAVKKKERAMVKLNKLGEKINQYREEEKAIIKKEKEDEEKKKGLPMIPVETVASTITNKKRRCKMRKLIKRRQKVAKRRLKEIAQKEAYLSGKPAVKQLPKTIESKRPTDETMLDPEGSNDEEEVEDVRDNFAAYYDKQYKPKVLITSSERVTGFTKKFMMELSSTMTNATVKSRRKMDLKKMLEISHSSHGFTDAIIVNEDNRYPSTLLICHLPDGPSAMFRLTNVSLCKRFKGSRNKELGYRPEIMLNNFKTRVGRTIARMLGALYHYEPEFIGRAVCTFHNQRDFIFFRHHRYQFRDTKKATLRELGPRFTLMLEWLKEGNISSDFEWSLAKKEVDPSRTKFSL